MPNFETYRPGSEDFERRIRGYVLANRINDIVARQNSQRYLDYLHIVHEQWKGEPVIDPDDQYRQESKELLPRALEAYSIKHGAKLDTNRVYFYNEPDIHIAALPDAIEADFIGLTVHVRKRLSTYRLACERELDNEQYRHAQAMMLITQCPYWLHVDYYEDSEFRVRKLQDRLVEFDRYRAEQLEEDMIGFLMKTRRERVA